MCYLFGCGEGGAVRTGAVFGGCGAAGDLVGVWQGLTILFSAQTLQVEGGLQETRVAVELHQVKDLWAHLKQSEIQHLEPKSCSASEYHKKQNKSGSSNDTQFQLML